MNFTTSQLDFSTINGYDFVSMPNTLFMMSPGYPSLPRKTLIFAIPAGSRVEAVEASVSDSTTVPSFAGNIHVTLTKQGYLPDEGEVRLLID